MADQGQFKRKLNLLDLTFLACGSIIGSGWLYGAMQASNMAGSLAWISWLIGAAIFLLIGLTYAEMGAAMPRSGGFLRYPDYSHGKVVGYLCGFASVLGYTSVIGVEVEAVRQYATYYWPQLSSHGTDVPTFLGFVVQAALVVIFFLINYWSVNFFGKFNTAFTFFKFFVPTLVVIILLLNMDPSNFSAGGASPGGINGVFQAVVGAGIAFSFLGFRQSIDFAGEARRPQRDVPWAIILSVILCVALYILLQISFIGAIPGDVMSGGFASIDWSSPWAKLAGFLGLNWLVTLVLIDAFISPMGTGNIFLSGTARMMFAFSKNGLFYSIFAKVDKRTGLPRAALWLALIMGVAWTLPSQFQTWSGLIDAVTSAFILTYMLGAVSVTSIRKNAPDMERPFKLKGIHWISPLAFIGASLAAYWSKWETLELLIPVTVGSLVLFFAFADKDKSIRETLKVDFLASIWLFVWYAFMLVISYFGVFGPGHLIQGPWDDIIVAAGSLILFYWGVASGLKKPRITADEEERGVGDAAAGNESV